MRFLPAASALFELACECDLEGLVAKWKFGSYVTDSQGTSWLKIKNPQYTQAEGRHELFESHRQQQLSSRQRRTAPPALVLR